MQPDGRPSTSASHTSQGFALISPDTQSTVTSREFTRDFGAAKRAAGSGPVIITDHGRPAFALLSIEDYYRLAGEQPVSFLQAMDAIACDDAPDFDAPRLQGDPRAVDFGEDMR